MSKVDDVIEALTTEESSAWKIADELAALDEIDPATGKPITLAQVSERIWNARGVMWSPVTLGIYRATARAFPIESRDSMHSFTIHKVLRAHPDKLLAWKPKRSGEVLTVEQARSLRGGSSASKPKPDAWKAQFNRAAGVIDRVAENDPGWVIDALEQWIVNLERRYPKARRSNGLRAV